MAERWAFLTVLLLLISIKCTALFPQSFCYTITDYSAARVKGLILTALSFPYTTLYIPVLLIRSNLFLFFSVYWADSYKLIHSIFGRPQSLCNKFLYSCRQTLILIPLKHLSPLWTSTLIFCPLSTFICLAHFSLVSLYMHCLRSGIKRGWTNFPHCESFWLKQLYKGISQKYIIKPSKTAFQ